LRRVNVKKGDKVKFRDMVTEEHLNEIGIYTNEDLLNGEYVVEDVGSDEDDAWVFFIGWWVNPSLLELVKGA
jgi:hypothetical protein